MKNLLLAILLMFTCGQVLAAEEIKQPEIKVAMNKFFTSIKSEYAYLSFDKAWLALDASKSGNDGTELKALLKREGPLKKAQLTYVREGSGARLVRLKYNLVFRSGRIKAIEFSYLKRLDSPYRIHEAKITN